MEVTRIEVFKGSGEEEMYELSPGEDLADLVVNFSDLFVRSRENKMVLTITRVKGGSSGGTN